MRKILLFSFLGVTIILLVLISKQSITTIQYFPPDNDATMDDAKTALNQMKNKHIITWSIYSNTSEKAYLRQDISLLYVNGYYKGVLRKWKQNVTEIHSLQEVKVKNDALIQAITFHYGETHNGDDSIHSVQKMTDDQLYFMGASPNPQNKSETLRQKEINRVIQKDLTSHWMELMTHFEIDASNYTSIPLTELITYQTQTLPNHTMTETNKVIGQFWEGLYKKYAVTLNSDTPNHKMPVILFAKDHTHLILLFEIGDEKYKYIQHI